MPADLTVAIPTYRRAAPLIRCLDALSRQTLQPARIYVFDSSEDDAAKEAVQPLLERFTNRLIYVHVNQRVILPAARNRILEACDTAYIAFLDDDAIPTEPWVESIMHAFQQFPQAAGVTGPTINATDNLTPLEPLVRDARPRLRILPWGEVRSDARRWVPSAPQWVTAMPGGNMAFPTKLLRETGGFDEALANPSFREETDVEFKLVRRGLRFIYDPNVFVWHVPGLLGGISDIEDRFAEYVATAGRNHRRVVDKYVPKWLSRLSWLLWSRNPPALWLAALLTIVRGKNYLAWHKGLWGRSK